jgi:hypothetical protein
MDLLTNSLTIPLGQPRTLTIFGSGLDVINAIDLHQVVPAPAGSAASVTWSTPTNLQPDPTGGSLSFQSTPTLTGDFASLPMPQTLHIAPAARGYQLDAKFSINFVLSPITICTVTPTGTVYTQGPGLEVSVSFSLSL